MIFISNQSGSDSQGTVASTLGAPGLHFGVWLRHLAGRGWNTFVQPHGDTFVRGAGKSACILKIWLRRSGLTQSSTYTQQIEDLLIGFLSALKSGRGGGIILTSSSEWRGCFLCLHGQSARRCSGEASLWKEEGRTRNKKNNSLMQSLYNQGKARDLPAAPSQWFYGER